MRDCVESERLQVDITNIEEVRISSRILKTINRNTKFNFWDTY